VGLQLLWDVLNLNNSLTNKFLFTPHHLTRDPFWSTSFSSEAIDKIKLLDA
jgi:hypothetical protein